MIDNEAIYYCTHCGAANKKSAVECTECEKKITTKYRPFYDFLKKHTKEEATGTAVDTVFGFVQNFLLSHVYGIVLSVTIVAAGIATVYADASYIKEVRTAPAADAQVTEEEQQPKNTFEISEDDKKHFEHLTANCDSFADIARNSGEEYWERPDYASPEEMYAPNNIEGFDYQGAHDIISNPLPIRWLDSDPAYEEYNYFPQNRYVDFDTLLTGEACTSDIATKLCSDGYKVAQVDYVLKSGVGITGEADFETWEGITTIQKLVYRFVFVEHEGTWYIVEDRLVERQNV